MVCEVKVTRQCQATIPKAIRRKYGIDEGSFHFQSPLHCAEMSFLHLIFKHYKPYWRAAFNPTENEQKANGTSGNKCLILTISVSFGMLIILGSVIPMTEETGQYILSLAVLQTLKCSGITK
jgi:hypothetical protein